LAAVVGIGTYAAFRPDQPSVKKPPPPVLLAIPSSRPTPGLEARPEPRTTASILASRLIVQDADHGAPIRPTRPVGPVPRLRLELPQQAGRVADENLKPLVTPRPKRESHAPRVPPVVAKPALKEPSLELHDGRIMTTRTIGRVRAALRLRPDQTAHWIAVEAILREIGREQLAQIRRGREPEVGTGLMMRLYYGAQPLLATLRPDQKERIRSLARTLGYGHVASML
jgi:hypothetical protein